MTAHATCATSAATSARDGVPLTVSTVVVSSQSGALSGTRFWKNDGPPAPLREALHQHRPAAHRAHQRLGDRGVVADEVELRLAALAEEDLAGTVIRTSRPASSSTCASLPATPATYYAFW